MTGNPLAENFTPEAALEERRRLARELHDSLGYTLTISMVQLENAAKLIGEAPKEAQEIVETVRERLASGLEDLRATLTSLRDHEISADVLQEAMQRLIGEFSVTTGIAVRPRLLKAVPPLTDAQATVLFRAAQEALINSFRHGQAEDVCVSLEIEDDNLVLKVKDDGRRVTPSGGSGFGLSGVHERVEQVGGSLRVNRAPEGGVTLTLRLPLKGVTYA